MPDLQRQFPRAYRLKNLSVYVGVAGYIAMIASGSVAIGAASKLLAELLRLPYFRATQAKDMERLGYFFISASTFAIATSFI